MIIQNTDSIGQAPQANVRVSDPAPIVTGQTPIAQTSAQVNQQFTSQQLNNAVDSINRALQQSNTNLELSVDPDTKIPVVSMVDTATGQLIRQYPSKETLAIAHAIDQYQHGLLLSQKA